MKKKIFVTAINCMDGRVQLPVIEWMSKQYTADYVDMITEPGPNKILAENKDTEVVISIKRRVEISLKKHGSICIAVVGHEDCAGNPIGKQTQDKQTEAAVKIIQTWGFPVPVIGLWVDENWKVYKLF